MEKLSWIVLRLAIVLVFLPSWWGKLGRVEGFSEKFGIPEWLGFLVPVFEAAGMALILIGVVSVAATRAGAALLAVVMLGVFATYFTSETTTLDSLRLPLLVLGSLVVLAANRSR